MDGVRDFLVNVKKLGHARDNLLGLLHVMIGRHIARTDGTVVSDGLTWRTAATWLKKVRWAKEDVRELGMDPASLPPRDRERFWYAVIAHAQIDSEKAINAGNCLAAAVLADGYVVGPPPK